MKAKGLLEEGEILPCSSVRDASAGTDDSDWKAGMRGRESERL